MIEINEILSLQTNQCNTRIPNLPQGLVLYGAGTLCTFYVRLCRSNGVEPQISDSNPDKIGTSVLGIEVQAFDQILSVKGHVKVVITTPNFYSEIKNHLMTLIPEADIIEIDCPEIATSIYYDSDMYGGFLRDNTERLNQLYEQLADDQSRMTMTQVIKGNYSGNNRYFEEVNTDRQYFPQDVLTLTEDEAFIDGGAYNGDTLVQFLKAVGGNYRQIYAFEPTESLFRELSELKRSVFDSDERIRLFNKGLFDGTKTLRFTVLPGIEGANHITGDTGACEFIEVVGIDDVVDGPVTFIKMDIEGSELMALRGARETILKNKPKLAICIYHKHDDILSITEYIRELGLDYKYYIRHHSDFSCETVFYAV